MERGKNEILKDCFIVPEDGISEVVKERAPLEVGDQLDHNVYSQLQIDYESDRGYHKIATQIVDISGIYLNNQSKNKAPLREKFVKTFGKLIKWQFIVLVVFLVLNSFETIPFKMSEYLLTTYIVSVFVETLGLIGVMITFSFTSKEESNIVEVLTTVIQNYQKYDSNSKINVKHKDNKS